MAKAPPKAGAKDLSYNSLKAFTQKHAFVDISVFAWLGKQRPRFAQAQHKGYFQMKELHRTTKAYSQMNPDWKVDKAQYAEFNVPTCGKSSLTAVQRKTAFVEQSWWPEFDMFGSMRQKLLPKLAQKNCHTTVWIYPWKTTPTIADSTLVSDLTDLFSFAILGVTP